MAEITDILINYGYMGMFVAALWLVVSAFQ